MSLISRRGEPGRAAFIFIFITVVLDMLALGVMVPVLPKLLVEFKGGDIAAAATISGVFGFAWAAMQFFFSPVQGSLSDRFGRRPIILWSNFGLGLDYLLMAIAPSLSWLFVGRIISGISAASYSTASAYITDVTPPEKRAARFGMLGAAFGLGFIIGPAIGGVLGGINLRLPFWFAAGLSLANAIYGFFILPESLPVDRRAKFLWKSANPLGSLKLLRSHPDLLALTAASVLYFVAHEALPSVFVLYTTHRYGWGESQIGIALAIVGICSMLVSALLIGPAVKKLGERNAMIVGLVSAISGFIIYGFANTGALFLVGIPVASLFSLIGPAMQSLMSRMIDPSHQGALQGALSSLRGVTGMIGPLLYTQIFAYAISQGTTDQIPGAPYLLAALLLGASLAVSISATRTSQTLHS